MYTSKSFLAKKELPSIDLPDCPQDSVSDICFNPESSYCAVSSWDGTVRLYKIPYYSTASSSFVLEKVYTLGKPVLSCCFFNSFLLAGLIDGSLVDTAANQPIKAHEKGIKSIKNYNNQFIVTASFDGSLKFWNLKSNNPMHTIPHNGKIYAMDLKGTFLVLAMDDRTVIAYDMNNPTGQPAVFQSKFNYAIRSIGCHKDLDSFVIGGVEAKLEWFSRSIPSKRMCIRCHRVDSKLYSVNVVRFYPNNSSVLVSGGADGTLVWFSTTERNKMCVNEFKAPVTAGEFSNDGKYFVFATGDDWSKGYTGTATPVSLKLIVVSNVPGITK